MHRQKFNIDENGGIVNGSLNKFVLFIRWGQDSRIRLCVRKIVLRWDYLLM